MSIRINQFMNMDNTKGLQIRLNDDKNMLNPRPTIAMSLTSPKQPQYLILCMIPCHVFVQSGIVVYSVKFWDISHPYNITIQAEFQIWSCSQPSCLEVKLTRRVALYHPNISKKLDLKTFNTSTMHLSCCNNVWSMIVELNSDKSLLKTTI